jgi:hypothetical protein
MPNSLHRPALRQGPVGVSPRPLLPVYEPVQRLSLPDLPSPRRQPVFGQSFTLTTHLVPAAHPRTYPDYPLPDLGCASSTKAEKKELAIRNSRTLLDYEDSQQCIGSRRPLWVCLNRYVRKEGRGLGPNPRLTLLLAHANGFPKEVRSVRLPSRTGPYDGPGHV